MRLSFLGSARPLEPIVLTLTNGQPFLKQTYVDQGYDNYEVLCIGAAGGRGGGVGHIVTPSGSGFAYFGGGGGGGGLHRVTGTLSSLASSVAVVVGAGGVNGANGSTNTSTDTAANGTAGGYSSFGGTLCQASGGNGGLRAKNQTVGTGGAGGIGNSTAAGAGASAGVNGTFNGSTGSGGGGGSGGVGQWFADVSNLGIWIYPTAGGRGNYNISPDLDSTVNAAQYIFDHFGSFQFGLEPYCGGGATARILNNQTWAYGSYAANGYGNPYLGTTGGGVLIKLTAN
jgi:hypothetical protein